MILALSVSVSLTPIVAEVLSSVTPVAETTTFTLHDVLKPFEVVAVMLVCPADNAVTLP